LNLQPADYKSAALPVELCQRLVTLSILHDRSGFVNYFFSAIVKKVTLTKIMSLSGIS
jgi:hypothetical protein